MRMPQDQIKFSSSSKLTEVCVAQLTQSVAGARGAVNNFYEKATQSHSSSLVQNYRMCSTVSLINILINITAIAHQCFCMKQDYQRVIMNLLTFQARTAISKQVS